jgi:hypothetical protein
MIRQPVPIVVVGHRPILDVGLLVLWVVKLAAVVLLLDVVLVMAGAEDEEEGKQQPTTTSELVVALAFRFQNWSRC